mmetsp:Transcript_128333/g.371499  ORF Transcript_128333/g.371499 Transcript_128333/m.371499 type:complete len:202 (-) Transcript_128333:412-1017(-)
MKSVMAASSTRTSRSSSLSSAFGSNVFQSRRRSRSSAMSESGDELLCLSSASWCCWPPSRRDKMRKMRSSSTVPTSLPGSVRRRPSAMTSRCTSGISPRNCTSVISSSSFSFANLDTGDKAPVVGDSASAPSSSPPGDRRLPRPRLRRRPRVPRADSRSGGAWPLCLISSMTLRIRLMRTDDGLRPVSFPRAITACCTSGG